MRPLINFSIHELEEQFDAKKHDLAFLNKLLSELKNRKTKRATDLRNRTVQALEVLPKSASPVRPKSQRHDEIECPLPEDDAPQSVKLPKAVKGLSDEPEQTSAPQLPSSRNLQRLKRLLRIVADDRWRERSLQRFRQPALIFTQAAAAQHPEGLSSAWRR